ncbi:DinB family protein [Niabella sp. 22666]|uniref:DinB family protein n=1 Tax=Niabella sp. 22666 TaxID=3453954 RepID=UPI003F871315
MTKTQEYIIHCIEAARKGFIELIEGLTMEQLNKIPQRCNNNIAWNFGHISVSALALAFKTSGVKPAIEIPYFKKYGKGTRPETNIDAEELQALKDYATTAISMIKESMTSNEFDNATIIPYTTATYGIPMTDIDEIIATIAMHDSLHYGIAKSLSRIV